LKLCR